MNLPIYDIEVSEANIWNFRQNNPELVVRDLEKLFNLNEEQKEQVRTVLMARGVNKWFKVRRDISTKSLPEALKIAADCVKDSYL